MNDVVKPRILILTTSVLQVKFFLVPHLNALAQHYDVTLALNNDHPDILSSLNLPIRIRCIPIQRRVSLFQDLRMLCSLYFFLKAERFDLVHTVNPKAGLLGIVAAWLARVPLRIHTFQGETWANKTGLWRALLRAMDKVVGLLATHLTVVSESERQMLVREGLIAAEKSRVLAHGSIGGVNLDQFSVNTALRDRLRSELGYVADDVVLMYLGRLTRDKGLLELGQAFENLAQTCPHARLLLVGPDEEHIQRHYQPLLQHLGQRVRFLPYSANPHEILQVADVLVLPSHREGFGVVIIEAAALGISAVASRIYGISDALVEGETGLMFEKQNVADLERALLRLCNDKNLRVHLGKQAQARAVQKFAQPMVIQAFLSFYAGLLGKTR